MNNFNLKILVSEITLLGELALAKDWNNPEEVKAWEHLQQIDE